MMISVREFALFLSGLVVAAGVARAQDDRALSVVTWGGSYQTSQQNAYEPGFEYRTGRTIDWLEYSGGLAQIRAQIASGEVIWDVVDVLGHEARIGCDAGLFERLPDDLFPQDMAGDLVIPRPNDCVAPNITWSWVVSFDARAFGEGTPVPATAADFFDTARFPGPRAIAAFPQANLELALMADGVAPADVYDVLSTDSGVDRAFGVLNRIAAGLRFWSSGEEPVDMLRDGTVAMSTAYNGRVAAAYLSGDTQIRTLYRGQVLDEEWFAVVAGSPNRDAAFDFLRHVAEPQQQAAQAKWIPYGPMRRSALDIIEQGEPWFHTGQPVLPHLPSRSDMAEDALVLDPVFWAENGERLAARFADWRRGLGL